MRLRCAPLTYELLWRVAQTLLTRADLLSRMQVRGVITFLLQEGPQEGRVRWRPYMVNTYYESYCIPRIRIRSVSGGVNNTEYGIQNTDYEV